MTKTRSTKSALISSVIALLLCFAMLVGSTFAWFTDSVTSANNVIKSGNLDIALDYWDGENSEWKTVEGTDSLFTNNLWEPGHTEVVYLKLSNLGSLALKYQLAISVLSETEGTNMAGDSFKLSDHIQMGVVENVNGQTDAYTTREAAVDAVKANSGIIGAGYAKQGNMLADAAELYMAVVVYMPETVGNEANAKTGTPAPTINLGVNVLATQLSNESDGFGPDYDEDAPLVNVTVSNEAELIAALAEAKSGDVIGISGNVTWTTGAGIGSTPFVTNATYITLAGVGSDATFTAIGSGVGNVGIDGGTVIFKNLTIADQSVSYAENSWEYGYLEFRGNTVFEDCDIVNAIMMEGDSAKFVDCSFNSNASSEYAVWVSDGVVSFENCYFTGTRGVKIHEAYGSEVDSVSINNSTFAELSEKPGVAIGTVNADTSISITNNLFASTQPGDQGNYKYESDTDVNSFTFVDENNTVISSVTDIAQLSEAFAKGGYIVLESDLSITLTENAAGFDYPIAFVANSGNPVVLDLNGHTIKVESEMNDTVLVHALDTDVTIKNGNFVIDGGQYSNLIWAKGNSNVTIENGTFESPNEDAIMLYVSDNNGEKATININGGEFISNGATAQNHINIRNHGLGKVIITGGTFNFNPDWSVYTDVHAVDDAAHIIIAEGYHSVDNGNGTWTVVAD